MASVYRFGCPACSGRLEAPRDMAGQPVPCPHCGESLIIPGTQPIGQAAANPPPLPRSLPTHGARAPEARNTLGRVALMVSLIGLVTFGLASPIGFALSLSALPRQPRLAAALAAILSAAGCLMLFWLLLPVLF